MPSWSTSILLNSMNVNTVSGSWGRVLAATGSVPLKPATPMSEPPTIDPTRVNVTFVPSDNSKPLPVLINGEPEKVDEVRAKEILGLEDFGILVDIGMGGDGEARYWTCDFSYVCSNSFPARSVDTNPTISAGIC